MNIPKTVKIGGRTFTVEYPYIFTERFDRSGDIDFQLQKIDITDKSNNLISNPESILVTLLHEIIHGIDYIYGAKLTNLKDDSEHAVEQLAEGLVQVFKDNPKLKSLF